LPVLEAAHIRPVADGGSHRLSNGLLLRSDVHTLFDRGSSSVTPAHRLRVSRRLKADFDNGEHYYQLEGSPLWVPRSSEAQPRSDLLEWHSDTVFRS
jgi:putative restriction endonuclease